MSPLGLSHSSHTLDRHPPPSTSYMSASPPPHPIHNPLDDTPAFISSLNGLDNIPDGSLVGFGEAHTRFEAEERDHQRQRRRTSNDPGSPPANGGEGDHTSKRTPGNAPSTINPPTRVHPPPNHFTSFLDAYSAQIPSGDGGFNHAHHQNGAIDGQNWALTSPDEAERSNNTPFDSSHILPANDPHTFASSPSPRSPSHTQQLRDGGAVQVDFDVAAHGQHYPPPSRPPLHVATSSSAPPQRQQHHPAGSSTSPPFSPDFVFSATRDGHLSSSTPTPGGSGPPSASTPSPAFSSASIPTPTYMGPNPSFPQSTPNHHNPHHSSRKPLQRSSRPSPTPEGRDQAHPYPATHRRPRRNTSDVYHVPGVPNGQQQGQGEMVNGMNRMLDGTGQHSLRKGSLGHLPTGAQAMPHIARRQTTAPNMEYPLGQQTRAIYMGGVDHTLNSLRSDHQVPGIIGAIATASSGSSLAAWNSTEDLSLLRGAPSPAMIGLPPDGGEGQHQHQHWFTVDADQLPESGLIDPSSFHSGLASSRYSPVVELDETQQGLQGGLDGGFDPAMSTFANQAYGLESIPLQPFSFSHHESNPARIPPSSGTPLPAPAPTYGAHFHPRISASPSGSAGAASPPNQPLLPPSSYNNQNRSPPRFHRGNNDTTPPLH